MKRKHVYAMYRRRDYDSILNKWFLHDPEKVRVMATAEGYSMIKFPRAMPFIVMETELHIIEDGSTGALKACEVVR